MCGIAGVFYSDPARVCQAEPVVAMRDIMAYRGPDDAGLLLDGPVGLGHRRLSIIDLGGGHQPMADTDGRNWIVFNGEIYNYRQIRDDLIRKGHTFRTQSDTEVILHLYDENGAQCVNALNGMFAFAIWDSRRRSLLLARDRMGVKPLYYAETGEGFVFASEIKALFQSGLIAPAARSDAFAEYMIFRQVAGADTMFRGVKALPPGCTMTVADGRSRISRYWSPRPDGAPQTRHLDEVVEELAALLEDAVRLRLVSDVPVGTFCSGGVDSSLITALAARLKSDPVNTYSVGFDEPAFDESAEALRVSAHCETTHHRLTVGNDEFSEVFPRMVWHNDEPLDFANSIQICALSQLAKQSVTVVLTGEGSDELFAGYPRYRAPDLAEFGRRVPNWLRRAAARATGDHRLAKLDRFSDYAPEDVLLFNASYNRPDIVAGLCPGFAPFQSAHRLECLTASNALGLDRVSRASLLDQETFLVGILNRQDKMSMAASIESRVPFMDYRIVELANRLPGALKMQRGRGKTPVKLVASRFLPSDIVDRRKSGFGVPLAGWMRRCDGLGERLQAFPDTPGADVFDRAVLKRLIDEHRAGQVDHSELLWTALNLAAWRDAFGC